MVPFISCQFILLSDTSMNWTPILLMHGLNGIEVWSINYIHHFMSYMFTYPSLTWTTDEYVRLFYWRCDNHMIAPVPVNWTCRIWVNRKYEYKTCLKFDNFEHLSTFVIEMRIHFQYHRLLSFISISRTFFTIYSRVKQISVYRHYNDNSARECHTVLLIHRGRMRHQ